MSPISEFAEVAVRIATDKTALQNHDSSYDVRLGAFGGQATLVTIQFSDPSGRLYLDFPTNHEPYRYRLRNADPAKDDYALTEEGTIWQSQGISAGQHSFYVEVVRQGDNFRDPSVVTQRYSLRKEGDELIFTDPNGVITRILLGETAPSGILRNATQFIAANETDDITVRRNGFVTNPGNQIDIEHGELDGVFLNSLKAGTVLFLTVEGNTSAHRMTADAEEVTVVGESWSRLQVTPDWHRPGNGTHVGISFLVVDTSSGAKGEPGPAGKSYVLAETADIHGLNVTLTDNDGAKQSVRLPDATLDKYGVVSPTMFERIFGYYDWAKTGNVDQIPRSKLNNAPGGFSEAYERSLNELLVFEAALKADNRIASGALRQAVSDASTRFPAVNGERPKLPANEPDRELLVTVDGDNPHRFFIKDLENKGGTNTAGNQLSDANSIGWQTSDGDYFRISYLTADRELVFAADNIGNYTVVITDYRIDLEDWARRSLPGVRIPDTKLPLLEFGLIHGAVQSSTLHDTPKLFESLLTDHDAFLLDDASVAEGEGSQLREIYVSELDKRWFRKNTRIPDSSLSKKAESFFGDATQGGWAFSTTMLVQSGVMPAAKPTLATAAARAYVANPARGPRFTNVYDMIRVPKGVSVANSRYVIGERDITRPSFSTLAGNTWESLGTQGNYDYYTVMIADKPADADQYIEEYGKFRIDGNKVEITGTGSHPVIKMASGAGTGITVTNSSADTRLSNAVGFSPAFDLDDSDKQSGIIQVEADIRLITRSSNDIGFNAGASASSAVVETSIEGFRFASAVRASEAYSATENGVLVGSVDVYKGSATLGELNLYLTRDANNVAGYWFVWEGSTGSSSFSVSVRELDAAFIHNDPGEQSAGGGGGGWNRLSRVAFATSYVNYVLGPGAFTGITIPDGATLLLFFVELWPGRATDTKNHMSIIVPVSELPYSTEGARRVGPNALGFGATDGIYIARRASDNKLLWAGNLFNDAVTVYYQ